MINIGYFLFHFTSVRDWETSFHEFPVFKKWCERNNMKISQGTTSHTRECVIVHGSAEKMGFPREDKTRQTKPQIFIFANLAFSETLTPKT